MRPETGQGAGDVMGVYREKTGKIAKMLCRTGHLAKG